MPQRVTKVSRGTLTMEPLWTSGIPRQAPQEEVKLIATFIPDLLREETRQLFPQAPWIPATTKSAKESPSEPTPSKPLTALEESQAIDLEDDETETKDSPPTTRKRARMFHIVANDHLRIESPCQQGRHDVRFPLSPTKVLAWPFATPCVCFKYGTSVQDGSCEDLP
jgi:hypothetical protein